MQTPTLGARIASYRRRRGLSQAEFAARLGRSVSWVSQVERDVKPVDRLSVLLEVARVLEIPPTTLLPEALRHETGNPAEPVSLGGELERLIAELLPELEAVAATVERILQRLARYEGPRATSA